MGDDVRRGKPLVTFYPYDGNLDDVSEVIDGQNVDREGVLTIVADE